jgi:hypothetical protein
LSDAAGSPILLEKNGELYRLERMEQEGNTPSPKEVTRSREGILQAVGTWKDIDTEAFKPTLKTGGRLPIVPQSSYEFVLIRY